MIRRLPDFAEAYHGRGLAYYHNEQEPLALEDFTKAIELKPQFADAYRNRAVTYLNRGEVRKAVLDLTAAMALFQEKGDLRAVEDIRRMIGQTEP